MHQDPDQAKGARSGPKPDYLKVDGDPAETIRRVLNVRKPEGGWPKPGRNGNDKKARSDK